MDLPIHPFLSLPDNQELPLWVNLGLRKIFLFNWEVNWGTQEISKADWNKPCTWSNTCQNRNSCIFDVSGNTQMLSLALTCFLPSLFSSAIPLCGGGFISLIPPHMLLLWSDLSWLEYNTQLFTMPSFYCFSNLTNSCLEEMPFNALKGVTL